MNPIPRKSRAVLVLDIIAIPFSPVIYLAGLIYGLWQRRGGLLLTVWLMSKAVFSAGIHTLVTLDTRIYVCLGALSVCACLILGGSYLYGRLSAALSTSDSPTVAAPESRTFVPPVVQTTPEPLDNGIDVLAQALQRISPFLATIMVFFGLGLFIAGNLQLGIAFLLGSALMLMFESITPMLINQVR